MFISFQMLVTFKSNQNQRISNYRELEIPILNSVCQFVSLIIADLYKNGQTTQLNRFTCRSNSHTFSLSLSVTPTLTHTRTPTHTLTHPFSLVREKIGKERKQNNPRQIFFSLSFPRKCWTNLKLGGPNLQRNLQVHFYLTNL